VYINATTTGCPGACANTISFNKIAVINNTSTANGGGIHTGNASAFPSAGPMSMSFSRLAGNTATSGSNFSNDNTTATVQNNWWGTNAALSTILNLNVAVTTFDPFIVLTHAGSPNKIRINQSSTLTGDMSKDNHGTAVGLANLTEIIGLPITFNGAVLGTIP